MTNKEIARTTEHRLWQIPAASWSFYQEWNDAIFLHWQVDVDELQKLIPDGLEIDLFEGKAWVSLVAFRMQNIRPKYLPSFPLVSNFNETNIRTYVKSNNKTGVYFLSIEGGKRVSCAIAKGISELPYRFSNIKRSHQKYQSNNARYKDVLDIAFSIGNKIKKKQNIDTWLTERYALFQDAKDVINQFEIHHLPWSLKEITINKLTLTYPRFESLIHKAPDKVHYSDGVQVLAWGKTKI